MKKTNWIIVGIAILFSLSIGWYIGRSSHTNTSQEMSAIANEQTPKILYYRNPMGAPDTSPV